MNLTARLQQFYIGYYGRPADPGGLSYWLSQANGVYYNQDQKLAAAFGSIDQAEFRALYTLTPTVDSFIARVYQNLFGRQAETEGLLYFNGVFREYTEKQGLSADHARAILIARIIDGASGEDRIAISNKVSLASQFTDQIGAKNVSISDPSDLALVRSIFTQSGAGSDAWFTQQRSAMSDLIQRVGSNDSVMDFMDALVGQSQGYVPLSNAAARVNYSSMYVLESDQNNGQIVGTVLLELTGDTFKGEVGRAVGAVSNLPEGLSARLVKTSDTTLTLSFSGTAKSHDFSNSVSNITVTLTDEHFSSLKAEQVEASTKTNFGIGFVDSALNITNGIVRSTSALTKPIVVDLDLNILSIGGMTGRPLFGSISQATGADFSGTTGTGKNNVTFTGDALSNSYRASALGDVIRGGGGDDLLQGGSGIDRFIFESGASVNGLDRIKNFDISKGDILDFSRFLQVTGSGNAGTQVSGSEQVTWANGDVLVWQGSRPSEIQTVLSLFAATATDTTTPFSFAQSDGKAVLITAGTSGNAYIWFIEKEANATSVFDPAKSVVSLSEVKLVGVLEGVSNLTLVPFGTGNFG